MTITTQTFLYEILLRFGPAGLVGAHAIDVERVADGDQVIADRAEPAREITSEDVATLVGEQNATLVQQLSAAQARIMDDEETIARFQATIEQLQAQLAVAAPPAAPEPVVSRRQLKLALYGAGILDQVEAFVAQADRAVQISWTEATEFRRGDPMLNQMAAAFGMDSAAIDQMFAVAAAL
jgi:hypothetical protein